MITSTESSRTESANKLPFASVSSFVSRKLIWSGKLSATAFPVTSVWFFACMSSNVSLQVRTLKVGFITTLESAVVGFDPSWCCTSTIVWHRVLFPQGGIGGWTGIWRPPFSETRRRSERKRMEIEGAAEGFWQWMGRLFNFSTYMVGWGLQR